MTWYVTSDQASAELYRLAQAAVVLRLYRETHGYDAPTIEELYAWVDRNVRRPIKPADEDYEQVHAEHPELARFKAERCARTGYRSRQSSSVGT